MIPKKNKKGQRKKQINTILLLASIALFIYIIFLFGNEAFEIIKLNVNFWLVGVVMVMAVVSFLPYTMRYKVIVEAYGKKVHFWPLFRHTLATFSVSYVTPLSRLGGEPVRVYMLKKEAGIDYKTGSASVLLDKYIEVLGGVIYIIAGFFVILALPQSPLSLKITLTAVILVILFVLGAIYLRGRSGKGYFSSSFLFFRLHKIKKIAHWLEHIEDVEAMMNKFFRHHKKAFLVSFFWYIITAITHIILIKVLLLSIGFNFSLVTIILIIAMWGLLSFVPTPAGLGALEGGQSALFILLEGDGAIGLAMTLILRFGYLIMVALGFYYLTQFSRRQIWKNKKYQKAKRVLRKAKE